MDGCPSLFRPYDSRRIIDDPRPTFMSPKQQVLPMHDDQNEAAEAERTAMGSVGFATSAGCRAIGLDRYEIGADQHM